MARGTGSGHAPGRNCDEKYRNIALTYRNFVEYKGKGLRFSGDRESEGGWYAYPKGGHALNFRERV